MILILEIIIVAVAFTVLIVSAAMVGRNAMAFGRSAKMTQSRVAPKVEKISIQGDRTRELGLRLVDRAEDLEKSGAVLTVTMNRMKVLVSAAMETKQKVDRFTGYIGL